MDVEIASVRFHNLSLESLEEEIKRTEKFLKHLIREKQNREEEQEIKKGDRIVVDPTTTSKRNGRKGLVTRAISS